MTFTIVTMTSITLAHRRMSALGQTGRRAAAVCGIGALMLGCATRQPGGSLAEPNQLPNTLSAAERSAGWKLLFDGSSTSGWRAYQADSMPQAWRVANGSIIKNVPTRDIVTRDQFGDFELVFDWKVATGGNSGVFYRATEEYERVYWSAAEYQLLDDPNAPDGRNRITSAGAAHSLYPSPAGIVKPAGEWNTARIVADGAHVEHWLNGQKLLEYELWSPDWSARVKASKFAVWPNFGRATRGYIAIQGDHRGDLEVRNIKIRELR
jgi:hypothetical protein